MTITQQILTVMLCILGTQIPRWLPFLVFSEKKEPPAYIRFLGNALPGAVFGMLVIYCLKDVSFTTAPHGLPELIAIAVTAGLHVWKRQTLISIAAGTVCYMLLVQLVF